MNVFEMVALVVFMAIVGGVLTNLIKAFSHRRDRKNDDRSFVEADELRDQILTLEDRIRVLERIVTDSNPREDLKRQFRELER
jgi:membrane protein implicated in regulation of membrane protease activity